MYTVYTNPINSSIAPNAANIAPIAMPTIVPGGRSLEASLSAETVEVGLVSPSELVDDGKGMVVAIGGTEVDCSVIMCTTTTSMVQY